MSAESLARKLFVAAGGLATVGLASLGLTLAASDDTSPATSTVPTTVASTVFPPSVTATAPATTAATTSVATSAAPLSTDPVAPLPPEAGRYPGPPHEAPEGTVTP